MMVNRYDFLGTTQGFEKTAQGFLRAKANLTRTGIFSYKSDSGIVRELRTDSEVFSAASLASIRGAPVTDLHPSETGGEPFVSPQNGETFAWAKPPISDKSGSRFHPRQGINCRCDAIPVLVDSPTVRPKL